MKFAVLLLHFTETCSKLFDEPYGKIGVTMSMGLKGDKTFEPLVD